MTRLRVLAHRVAAPFRRAGAERDLDDEIETHIALVAADYERQGMPPAEARLTARREFGAVQPMKERYRDLLRLPALDDVRRDVGYAMRALQRAPAFSSVAVMTIALGIGANTAIFSVVEALLLRPLPVREPHELVQLTGTNEGRPMAFSYPLVREIARRGLFESVFGFGRGATATIGDPGALEVATVATVTGAYYDTLGLTPLAGRLLRTSDDEPGAAPVMVLSHGYWQRRFGGDPGVVGRSITYEGVPVTIAGVSPAGFTGVVVGRPADITMPIGVLAPNSSSLMVMGRLPEGTSIEYLEERVRAAWPGMIEAVMAPGPWMKRALAARLEAVPGGTGWAALRERFERPLAVLMALVSMVMLIACASVANLLLARTSSRRRELTTRLALGAGRSRVVRQVLIESLLLSAAGALIGMGLAWFGSRTLLSLIQSGETAPLLIDVSPDLRVLTFTVALAVVTGLLFGAVPAWRSATFRVAERGRESSWMVHSRGRLGPALVAVQVAVSVLLLVTAGLFVRTLQNLRTMDTGFRHEDVLTFTVTPPDDPRSPASTSFLESISQAVRRVPGVRSVSFAGAMPVGDSSIFMPLRVEGRAAGQTLTHYIAPGYVEAMRMTLRSGRDFTNADDDDAPLVAIVNEAFARTHLEGRDPLTQSLGMTVNSAERRIVGVAADAIHLNLRTPPPPAVYLPFAQMSAGNAWFGSGAYAVLVSASFRDFGAIRTAVASRVAGPPPEIRSLTDQVERTLIQERLMALLAGTFAVLALMLSAVGLYGLLSYAVSQRTSELGVRTALGATPVDVVRLVMSDASRMIGAGIAAGLPLAWIASRSVRTMLFGLEPTDPATIAAALAVLALAAAVAAYQPARRAARVDPVIALRTE